MESKSPEELLTLGYSQIRTEDYQSATETFSQALNRTITDKSVLCSLFIGRSTSNYLLGNDCNAFYDACKAIEADPNHHEGYVRRANVFLIYSFFNEAIADMKKAQELCKDSRLSQELNQRANLMERVKNSATANVPNRQNFLSVKLPEALTTESARSIGTFVFDQKGIEKDDVRNLFKKLREIFEGESKSFQNGIGRLSLPKVKVLGRIDGDVGKLYAFFDKNGYPSKENVYLINGNFIGRGDHRVLFILFLFKAAEPTSIYFTKGLFDTNGFDIKNSSLTSPNFIMNSLKFIENEFGEDVSNDLIQIVSCLPLCYIVNEKIAVTSGGPHPSDTFCLWGQFSSSKKTETVDGFPMFAFGEDDVESFLQTQKVDKVICSNKVLSEGIENQMNGKYLNVSFGKTDHRVFGYKLGYALISNQEVETHVEKFDFFPLSVHYDENKQYYEGLFFHMRKYTDINPAKSGFIMLKAISEDLIPASDTIDTSIYQFSYMSAPSDI